MITLNLKEAKPRVINLVRKSTSDFCSDMLKEIKHSVTVSNDIDDIEMFVSMYRDVEEFSKEIVGKIEEAYTLGDILKLTSDNDVPGNVLFEQDHLVLKAIFETDFDFVY